MDTPPDAVDARKLENPACAHLTSFYFIEHENFQLHAGVTETLDVLDFAKELGPTPLVEEELEDIDADPPASVPAFAAKHGLCCRWVYAYRREPNGAPEFRAELWVDANGNVHTFARKHFEDARPAGDYESDDVYLRRAGWIPGRSREWGFAEIATVTCGVNWHFYGSRVRLDEDSVLRLEDAAFFVCDPGSTPRHLQGSSALVRVLDPLTVGRFMQREYAERLARWRAFEHAGAPGANKDLVERRLVLVDLAQHVALTVDRRPDAGDELAKVDDTYWNALADECLTEADQEVLRKLAPPSDGRAPHYFIYSVRSVHRHYLHAVLHSLVKLLKWFRSTLWKFAEDSFHRSPAIEDEHAATFFEVAGAIVESLGEVDAGQGYLHALASYIADHGKGATVPNQQTIGTFVLLDPAQPPGWLGEPKSVHKAGMLGLDVLGRFTTILVGLRYAQLKSMLRPLPEKFEKMLAALPERQRLLATVVLLTYGRANLIATDGKKSAQSAFGLVFADARKATMSRVYGADRHGTAIAATPEWSIWPLEDNVAAKRLAVRVERIKDFANVVNGCVALLSAIDAIGQSRVERAKNVVEFVKSVYDIPGAGAGIEAVIRRRLGANAQGVAGKLAAKSLGLTVQAASVAVNAWGYVEKQKSGSTEERWAAGFDTAGDVLMLMAILAGTSGPVGLALGVAGVALAGAGFLIDLYKPTDADLAIRYCRFGNEYTDATSEPNERAKPWQACRDHDLQWFNPKYRNGGLQAYRRQILSFRHLLYAFRVQAVRGDGERSAGIVLFAGTVPRGAYYEVQADITAKEASGASWSYPRLSFRCDAELLDDAGKRNVSLRQGGPFDVTTTGSASEARLMVIPRAGDSVAWKGTLEGTGLQRVKKRSHAKVRYTVAAATASGHRVTIVPSTATTAAELAIESIEVEAIYARSLPDSPAQQDDARKSYTTSTLTIDVPEKLAGSTYETRLRAVRVRVTYRDTQSPKTPPQTTAFGSPAVPEQPAAPGRAGSKSVGLLDEYLEYLTNDRFSVRLQYAAELPHDGTRATVVLRFYGQELKPGTSPSWLPTKSIVPNEVELEYLRDGEQTALTRELALENDRWVSKIEDGSAGSVEVGRSVSVRAAAVVHGVRITEDEQKGPFVVRWGYGDSKVDERSRKPHELTEVDLHVRMVIDGLPKEEAFMPDDLTRDDHVAWATVGLTTYTTDGIPDVGVLIAARSVKGEVNALDACRSKPA